jgi:hypothetical protein
MKWEVKEIISSEGERKWGVFLISKYTKSNETVCYGVSLTRESAELTVKRMNNEEYWNE